MATLRVDLRLLAFPKSNDSVFPFSKCDATTFFFGVMRTKVELFKNKLKYNFSIAAAVGYYAL